MVSVLEHFDVIYFNFGSVLDFSWSYFVVVGLVLFLIGVVLLVDDCRLSGSGRSVFAELIVTFVGNLTEGLAQGSTSKYGSFVLITWSFLVFGEVLFLNLLALVPWGLSLTSFWIVAFFFAAVTWWLAVFCRVVWASDRLMLIFISEAAGVMKLAVMLIEIFSYILSIVSLHLRLMANILAGHALLSVLFGLLYGVSGLLLLGSLSLITVPIFFLELLVAFIQAYIFVLLAVIYLSDFLLR